MHFPTGNVWPGIVTFLPAALLTLGIVVISLIALGARSPATRRHHLSVIAALTEYVRALRAKG
jgi:hypothetical protein